MYLDLLKIDLEHTAFVFFKKDGNFYFAKDFSLLKAKKSGELYRINDKLTVPNHIPPGTYKVYFTFRIPESDYRYRRIENRKITNKRSVFVKQIIIE